MGVSNDTYAWLVRNRIVTLEMMKDDLVDYFSNSDEVLGEVLWPEGGFFDGVTLVADGNDKFKIGGLSGVDGAVGGDLLNLTDRQADVEGVQFENTVAVDYHVGLRDARLPDPTTPNITVNPKDGLPNWTYFRHIIGNQDVPDVIVDNGDGTITFTVDTITEAGVSNAGRQVYVFMPAPPIGAITDAIAIELCTVAWDGSNNKITTVGKLGQTTVSISKPAYTVILVGPHVLRNTDISTDTSYAYVGTVQGVGAGGPPTVFDVSDQRLLSASSSLLWQITRVENVPPNRLKIDVKALVGESGVDQIRVTHPTSGSVFKVDEAGNVTIGGNLNVLGTTTTRDVDQVNAYNAYFDSLEAGNADTDIHAIQGEWTHTSAGGGITAFAIDGDTGRVGIGGTYDAAAAFKVTGDSLFDGGLLPSGSQDLGAVGNYWDHIYATSYNVGSHFVPDTTASYDLGESGTPLKWKDLFLSGTAYADTGIDIASSAIVGDAVSLALKDIPFRISATGAGVSERNWALEIVSGVNEVLTLATKLDPTWGAGAAFFEAKRAVNSTAIEKITLTATQVFITSSFYVSGTSSFLGKVQPAGHKQWELGDASNYWKKFYLSSDAGHGVINSLMPVTKGDLVLGSYDMATEDGYMWDHFAFQTGILAHTAPSLRIFKEGQSADEGGWEFAIDGTKNFEMRPISDAGAATNYFLKVVRGAGVAMSEIIVGSHFRPAASFDLGTSGVPWRKSYFSVAADEGVATSLIPATTALDLGNASYPWQKLFVATSTNNGVATNLYPAAGGLLLGTIGREWSAGYFSGAVNAQYFQATGDPGSGIGGTTIFTDGTAAGAGVNGSIGAAGGNANVGFIIVYVGATTAYIPYWDNITT